MSLLMRILLIFLQILYPERNLYTSQIGLDLLRTLLSLRGCWLEGGLPRFSVNQPNKSPHYWPFRHQPAERGSKFHPKQYGGILEPIFYTLRWFLCCLISSIPDFTQVASLWVLQDDPCVSFFNTSVKGYDCPSCSPSLLLRCFHAAMTACHTNSPVNLSALFIL